MSSLRLAFMGSPDFSVPVLAEILAQGHNVVCVYAQPPRPAGRGQEMRETAVHLFAEAQGIEVRTPKSLRSADEQAAFAALELDVAIVVAYGLILPKEILDAPRLGCLNVHASLLPRWRGAAPIQRAIMAGDTETGVMIMQMDEGLDTGPVLLGEQVPITPRETYASLHDKLSETGASLMGRALAALSRGSLDATPQAEDGVTYAKKIEKSEARIDWSKSAVEVDWHVRGLHPFPGAFFEVPGRKGPVRVKVLGAEVIDDEGAPGEVLSDDLRIACGNGALHITDVQPAGKGAMKADAFLRGTPVSKGTLLT